MRNLDEADLAGMNGMPWVVNPRSLSVEPNVSKRVFLSQAVWEACVSAAPGLERLQLRKDALDATRVDQPVLEAWLPDRINQDRGRNVADELRVAVWRGANLPSPTMRIVTEPRPVVATNALASSRSADDDTSARGCPIGVGRRGWLVIDAAVVGRPNLAAQSRLLGQLTAAIDFVSTSNSVDDQAVAASRIAGRLLR